MDVAHRFGSMALLMQADRAQLENVAGVGPILAQSLMEFFDQPEARQLIRKLDTAGVKMTEAVRIGPQPLANTTFVFTGELSSLSRTQAEALVQQLGGNASSSVSRLTNYVVVGADPGSKFEKAKQLGVKILDETQFKKLVG